MSRTLVRVLRSVAFLALVAALAACGKPTIEGAISGYKTAKDKLDALVAKVSPQMKMDIRKKIAEFDKEFKEAEAKGGEAAMKAIYALTTRVNKYRNAVDPQAGKKGTANAGSKLNKGKTGTAGTARPATGGKLGNTSGAAAPAPAKSGSGFGSGKPTGPRPATGPTTGPRPATGPNPGARPATKPAGTGGSGFGGK